MNSSVELNFRELFAVLIHKLWLIVLCAVLAGLVAFGYTAKFVTPLYQASTMVYVTNTVSEDKVGITSSDVTTSQKLVATYSNVIKSESFLRKVVAMVDNRITTAEIRKSLNNTSVSTTEMFKVTFSNPDPQLAADVTNAIAEIVPTEIPKIVIGSSARIVDYAQVPTAPYSPSYSKNIMLGACIGALAVIIVLVAQLLLDMHITDEEDIRKYSNAPVLGLIPNYETVGKVTGYEYDSLVGDDNVDSKGVEV